MSASCSSPASSSTCCDANLLIKMNQPLLDGQEVAKRASQAAGVPVRYRSASSDLWHAVTLTCDSPEICQQALQRLRKDPAIASVDTDGSILHSPPPIAP